MDKRELIWEVKNHMREEIPELLDVDPTVEYIDDIEPTHREDMSPDSFIVTSDRDKNLYIEKNTAFKSLYDSSVTFTESAQRTEKLYGTQFKTPAYPNTFITFLTRNNWVFRQCAERVANDCVKNGFDIVNRTGIDNEEDILAKEEVLEWFNRMPVSITNTVKGTVYNYETGGNAGIEIIRENGVDSPLQYLKKFDVDNIKLCADDRRIVQTIDGSDTFFVLYGQDMFDGEKRYLNRETGQWSQTPLDPEVEAHEVLWLYRDDRGANEYGIPQIAPGMKIIEMEIGRQNYIIDFFINFGMPAWIVTITGTFYDEESKRYLPDGSLNPAFDVTKTLRYKIGKQIQEIIDGGHHGAIVMSFPTSSGQEPVKVTITPLATDVKEASFRGMKEDNGEDLCGMMGVDPNLILRSKTGAMGNNAMDSTLLAYNDNKVKPTQNMIANEITRLLIFENDTTFTHDISNLRFKLLDYIEQNITENVTRDMQLVEHGLMKRREFQSKYSKSLNITSDDEEPLLDVYCINGVPLSVIAEQGLHELEDARLEELNEQVMKAGVDFERRRRNIKEAKGLANKRFLSTVKERIRG